MPFRFPNLNHGQDTRANRTRHTRLRGLLSGRRSTAWWMSRSHLACSAIRPRQCPCSTGCSTPSRHSVRQQRLDVSMSSCSLSPGRTRGGTRGCVAGGWGCRSDRGSLACLAPFLGLVCSCSEFSEMLVSYLGVGSPAASSPGVLLGASFSGYSGGRQRFVVDAGGWEVVRVQMPGDRWRDAHDPTVFDLVSLAGISGRGAEWHLQHGCPGRGLGRCTGRGMAAVARGPALSQTIASFTVDGRRMLYDVKRISFFPIASQLLPESLLAYGCSGL